MFRQMSDREFADFCVEIQRKRLALLERMPDALVPEDPLDLLPDDVKAEARRRAQEKSG